MDELSKKIAFLEARLTLLERRFVNDGTKAKTTPSLLPVGTIVQIECDQPGLSISRKYLNERDELNRKFCWIGNEGPIQIVLPFAPAQPLQCKLRMIPHPKVDMGQMRLISNDRPVDYSVRFLEDVVDILFNVSESGAPQIDILLTDLESVRPSDFKENDDERLLAVRFLGAELTVI